MIALKEADWQESRLRYGVRQAYLLSAETTPMTRHREAMQQQREQQVEQERFIVHPPGGKEKQERDLKVQREERKRAEEQKLRRFVTQQRSRAADGSAYTLVLPLTDRNEFIGGSMLVEHELDSSLASSKQRPRQQDLEEDGDEDEEDGDVGEDIEEGRRRALLSERFAGMLGVLQGIESLTPEKGSLLLLPGSKRYGIEALQFGKRKMLVLELWVYRDAPISNVRPSWELGRELGEMPSAAEESKEEL
jgi:hypothetical protein